ncbi:hypothetical protein IQ06DRAFT_310425 [Phaeosphaeriaceae sp. SRC1lsM3a]|nr:hypothetical protein IQ06DRAFT_310425 [Stagonospora sp. SRC1lsM3a]
MCQSFLRPVQVCTFSQQLRIAASRPVVAPATACIGVNKRHYSSALIPQCLTTESILTEAQHAYFPQTHFQHPHSCHILSLHTFTVHSDTRSGIYQELTSPLPRRHPHAAIAILGTPSKAHEDRRTSRAHLAKRKPSRRSWFTRKRIARPQSLSPTERRRVARMRLSRFDRKQRRIEARLRTGGAALISGSRRDRLRATDFDDLTDEGTKSHREEGKDEENLHRALHHHLSQAQYCQQALQSGHQAFHRRINFIHVRPEAKSSDARRLPGSQGRREAETRESSAKVGKTPRQSGAASSQSGRKAKKEADQQITPVDR